MKNQPTYVTLPDFDYIGAMDVSITDYANQTAANTERATAVAPCFMNPETELFGMQKLDGTDVLTVDGQIALFPGHRVNENLADTLTKARRSDGKQHLRMIDTFNVPHRYLAAERKLQPQMEVCYALDDKLYVHHQDENFAHEWYTCEPIRVKRQPDGSLQCRDVLFVAPHDNEHAMEKYLNDVFLPNIKDSATLVERAKPKLSTLNATFNPDHLKSKLQAEEEELVDVFSTDGVHYMEY